jgi:phosphoinositide-3-kinase regulatory subunit 4
VSSELSTTKLSLVNVITPANASIFPEYIIPNIHPLVNDPEVSVRSLYAQCIVHLADVAVRYLEMGQALKAHGTFKVAADAVEYDEAQFEVSPTILRSINTLDSVVTRCRTT